MDDKIKLVFSWIGPNGPVWNTELPNVLNLARASLGGNTTSNRYFCDDLAKLFDVYSDNIDYELYPAVSIKHYGDDRPFVYPFTLAWRIPMERYFSGNEGILEFSHTPSHIIDAVRNRNGYILINHSIEAFMQTIYLDALHAYFKNSHYIPLHKIIYLTGCINAKEIYEKYCNDRGIPDDPVHRLSIVVYPTSFTSFVSNTEDENDAPTYDPNDVPESLFLMWNRRIRDHRIELAVNLERYNLVSRSLISFCKDDPDIPGRTSVADRFNYARLEHIFNIDRGYADRFINRLPLVLDGENNVTQMCQDYGNKTRTFYQRSLVSLITETNFYDNEVSLTEKSFKPTKEKHPFIIAGVNGVLKGMHDLGFKTFGEFWDESYDNIVDHGERMNAIMDVCRYIGTWTPEQILDFRHKVKPILEHNYNIIRSASTRPTIDKITMIVRKNI